MVLTRCVVGGEVSICDVSLVSGKVVIHNIPKGLVYDIRVSDIVSIYKKEDKILAIKTSTDEVLISISGASSSLINDIGRVVELKVKYDELSTTAKDLLIITAKALHIIVDVVKAFYEDYLGRWALTQHHVKELYRISEILMNYGINVKQYVDELNNNVNLRSVGGVKKAVKELTFNIVRLVEERVKSLLIFEDLRPLIDLIVIAYVARLAYLTNQRVESSKAEEDLMRECSSEVYVRMLNRPELDICRNFMEVLRSANPYEAIKVFLDNYLRLLDERIRKLLSS